MPPSKTDQEKPEINQVSSLDAFKDLPIPFQPCKFNWLAIIVTNVYMYLLW